MTSFASPFRASPGQRADSRRRAGIPAPFVLLLLVATLSSCEAELDLHRALGADLLLVEEAGHEGTVGQLLVTNAELRAVDEDGGPVAGARVFLRVAEGGGKVTPDRVVTDAEGVAPIEGWTLGPAAGTQVLEASLLGVATVRIPVEARPDEPAVLEPMVELPERAPVGSLAGSPLVRVTDRFGNPVRGESVRWTVTAGDGAVERERTGIASDGRTSAGAWTLGSRTGENALEARVEGLEPHTFTVEGEASAPARARAHQRPESSVQVGGEVATLPVVRVEDAFGNAVEGVPVRFRVVEGDGVLSGRDQQTDAKGRATPAAWQLGTRAGRNAVHAEVEGMERVRFTVTGTPSTPRQFEYSVVHHQHAPVGKPAPIRPAVRVRDGHGNRVPGVKVHFELIRGGGKLEGAEVTTNQNGEARVGRWTLSRRPGETRVQATAEGFDPLVFVAVGEASEPAEVRPHRGSGQSTTTGAPLPAPPAARVLDSFGNPVAGVEVRFRVVNGGGSIQGSRPRTNADGVATAGTWTLGHQAGRQTLLAEVSGAKAAEFRATGIAPPGGGDSGGSSGTGGGGGSQPPPPPPPPPAAPTTPPPPGPNAQGWTGNTISVRIIEGGSRTGSPVPVTIIAGGQARTFHRGSVHEGRTVQVPRGVPIRVIAHFRQSPHAGVGHWGFSALKFKAMRNATFNMASVFASNQTSWEPRAAGHLWGGHLRTYCGSQAPTRSPLPDFWQYDLPLSVTSNPAVDYIVVWLMDHQVPRFGC